MSQLAHMVLVILPLREIINAKIKYDIPKPTQYSIKPLNSENKSHHSYDHLPHSETPVAAWENTSISIFLTVPYGVPGWF